ncbi:MAG: biotin-dependent carboxyltransferase family protein [Hyphomicrobiaceae bacterium]|nr:biotin-dependent carboxyltransferase family protein [Hyphomicrobiaceae bacterium]
MIELEIISCGPATSLQDMGRPGWSRIGLPSAGAMDPRALRLANELVANDPGEAAIEMAFTGLAARVSGGPMHAAVAGARTRLRIAGRAHPENESFVVEAGETLEIAAMSDGVYAMLAVEGGFAIAPSMGSRSLDLRAAIGGWQGRPLRAGDVLPLRRHPAARQARAAPVPLDLDVPVRVVLGPQEDAFTERGLQTLIGRTFMASPRMSRMAYRLDGPAIERRPGVEMISEGTMPGSIQVPPDGQPLVLMADRQTVGGYPKIATVISTDLGRLAQRRPGQSIVFQMVSALEAREIACQSQLARNAVKPVGFGENGQPHIDAALLSGIGDAVVDAVDFETWEYVAAQASAHR